MKTAHIIWAHPRENSLTSQVVTALKAAAAEKEINVRELDLYRAGFDPVLREEDEPDFSNSDKPYSEQVYQLFDQMAGSDMAFVVFPVWWYSMPAILKGYVDRVWNYGLTYGNGKQLPYSSIRWIALVGGAQGKFESHKKMPTCKTCSTMASPNTPAWKTPGSRSCTTPWRLRRVSKT